MALPLSKSSAIQDLLTRTRDNVIHRLLTTTENGHGIPRKDITVLFFGEYSLDETHHLDTIDLLVAGGVTPQRFHSVAEERLAGDEGGWGDFTITPLQDTDTPCEIQLSSKILVRLWYLRSAALHSWLAAHLEQDRLFVNYAQIDQDARAELDVAIGSVSNPRFIHYFFDSRSGLPDVTNSRVSNSRSDDTVEDGTPLGSLKICFHRKVPVFDAREVLELDQKVSDFDSLTCPSQSAGSSQPRRWRSRSAQDCICYIVLAPASQAGFVAEQRICTLLGAASANYSQEGPQSIDMSEFEPDYGLSYGSSLASRRACADDAAEPAVSGPLPPAEKVFNRIRWDESINENDIEIHYLDRHEGIMKKAFTEWLRDTEEEDFVPMHRVRAFVRRSDGAVLWDRGKRIFRIGHE